MGSTSVHALVEGKACGPAMRQARCLLPLAAVAALLAACAGGTSGTASSAPATSAASAPAASAPAATAAATGWTTQADGTIAVVDPQIGLRVSLPAGLKRQTPTADQLKAAPGLKYFAVNADRTLSVGLQSSPANGVTIAQLGDDTSPQGFTAMLGKQGLTNVVTAPVTIGGEPGLRVTSEVHVPGGTVQAVEIVAVHGGKLLTLSLDAKQVPADAVALVTSSWQFL